MCLFIEGNPFSDWFTGKTKRKPSIWGWLHFGDRFGTRRAPRASPRDCVLFPSISLRAFLVSQPDCLIFLSRHLPGPQTM